MSASGAVVSPPPGLASNTWSDTDPILVIVTPGGHQVPLYVNNGVFGAQHLASAQVAKMAYTVQRASNGTSTKVVLTVTIPNDTFGSGYPTRTIPSTGAFGTGLVYGITYGTSGTVMKVTFFLPVS
jgi:hypothetical protein